MVTGASLGPYRILDKLGAGGMGEVYRARDTRLDRTVAVKILPEHLAADPQFRARFEREARAASALNHPNILSIFDVGRERDTEYLVTELVDGITLRERIGDRGLPAREVVALGAQIADGLAAAHAAGLVHRDLKPENVMTTRDGRAKILDFGLAKPVEGAAAAEETQAAISEAGLFVGTAGYASPEQVSGQQATPQSDLFSLGVILYEMTTGRRAFSRPTVVETLHAILHDEVPELPPDVPGGLQQIVAHCLEKNPARRFQHAADVAFALRSFASTSTASTPVLPAAPRARVRWMRAPLALAAALALLGGGYLAARLTTPAGVDLSSIQMIPYAVEPVDESSGAISPDGRSVAYVRSSNGTYEIVVRGDNSPAPIVLTRGPLISEPPFDLSWSADGARVYFHDNLAFRSVATVGGDSRDELTSVNGAALAPDGKTFAAVRVGTGQQQAQLFVGTRDHLQPYDPPPVSVPFGCVTNFVRFSPDGSQILLWLACDTTGILVVPTPGPDGKGGAPRRLWATTARTPQGVTWLNDSRHVVFASGNFTTPGAVWLGDTVTGALTHVTEALAGLEPLSAAADNTVALTESVVDYDVVEMPLAGGAVRTLVESARYDGSAVWSPDGRMFAYVANRSDGDEVRVRSGSDQSERRLVTRRDFPEQPPSAMRALSFSPDGQWLAFAAYTIAPVPSGGIWIVPASGGTPRRVSSKDTIAFRSAWAPDGRSLAISESRSGPEELWVTNVGESSSRQISLPADLTLREMEWSPRGNVIAAFESHPDGSARPIVLIDAATGAVRRFGAVRWSVLTWSGDGARLYGIASADKGSELQTLDVATGAMRTVAAYDSYVAVAEDFGNNRRLTWSPDRQSLVTTRLKGRSNVWLLRGLLPPR